MLNELASAGRENLDADHVARYDGKMDAGAAEEVATLRRVGLAKESVVVDIGAGTGQFTLAAAAVCRRVVAVDVSPVMLERLRMRVNEAGLSNVEVVQGGFLTYVHDGDAADVIYSRYALHHLPDFWKALALARIASVLRPGGVLRLRDIVFSCEPDEAERVIEGWLARAADRPEHGWTRPELEKDVREEHPTFSWLLEPLLERAGFAIREASHHASRVFSAYTCVKPG